MTNYESMRKALCLFVACWLCVPAIFSNACNVNECEVKKNVENNITSKTKPISVYLTFDDGPSKVTASVLDILKEQKIEATFFVNGRTDKFSLSMYKRIADEHHAIGNHSYTHDYKAIYKSVIAFEEDFNQLQQLLKETIGFEPKIMRFPGGSNNSIAKKQYGQQIMNEMIDHMTELGYHYFDWNVSAGNSQVGFVASDRLVKNATNLPLGLRTVILLIHDSKGKESVIDALPKIIAFYRGKQAIFKKLEENSPVVHYSNGTPKSIIPTIVFDVTPRPTAFPFYSKRIDPIKK